MATRSQGKNFLLQVSGTSGLSTLSELTSNSFSINNSEIDVTNKDSGSWQEKFAAGTIKSAELSGEGVFSDAASVDTLKDIAMNTTPSAHFRMLDGLGDYFEGQFQVNSFELTGETEGFTTYSVSLGSTGVVTSGTVS